MSEDAKLTWRPEDDFITTGADCTIKTPSELEATSFILKVGEGRVVISMKTGKVTFENCEPDEAAKSFWEAVERYAGKGKP